MTDKDVGKYCTLTDKSLHDIYIATEAVQMKIILMLSINCIVILLIH